MKRREFITLLGGAAAAPAILWPVATRAQQPPKVARIGFLGAESATAYASQLRGFRQGLADLGYIERTTLVIEYRWAEGKTERLPDLAVELVRSNMEVIVAHGTPGILAAKRATATIPIVMATSGDAEGSGLVASLAQPGGNVTGSTFFNPELVAKRFELLKETLPGLTEVGLLLNPANPINEPIVPMIKPTARALGLEVHPFGVRGPAELEGAFAAMAAKRVGAVVVIDDATLIANASAVARLALQQRLPSSGWPDYAIAGGLIGYGVSFPDAGVGADLIFANEGNDWATISLPPRAAATRCRATRATTRSTAPTISIRSPGAPATTCSSTSMKRKTATMPRAAGRSSSSPT